MTAKRIKVYKNKIFKNKLGNLVKYISKKDKFYKKFGETYFNYIKYKKIKGWIKHKKNSCLMQCVYGKILFKLVDHNNKKSQIILKSNSGDVLFIPPKVWFSFQSLFKTSILVNTIEEPHNDKEIDKRNFKDNVLDSK
mgnify:CR=1 FL=1